MKRSSIILTFILFCIFSSYGQHKEANVWIFGKHVGLDFNFTPPAVLHSPVILTQEGCASIADSLGTLAFYTDGITIWNRIDEIMMNCTQLRGHNSSTQSGIIVPKPNDPNFYYVFTVPYQGDPVGLQYSEVDMTLAGGLGGVTELKNKQLVAPVTEKVTAMSHYNNEDIWVITHKWQDMEIIGNDTFYIPSNEFYAYLVTDEGVDSIPVVSSIGIEHGGSDLNTVGYLKGSPDGEKIALAIFHSDVYQLFNFDNQTGTVNSPITFDGYKRAYGLEFSPNSRILYLSEEDVTSQNLMHIYQIDLFAGTPQEIVESKTIIGTTTNQAAIGRGALQVGPDQKIYIARGEMNYLGVINNPNIWGSFECGFVNDGIWLECNTSNISKYGLPTFIQTYFSPPVFEPHNLCFGDETLFEILSDITGYESVFWEFGDGATSTELNPIHQYAAAGDYIVTLTIFYETTERIAEDIITILTSPDPAFSYDDYCFDDPTQFYDQSSPNGGTISGWNWNFGDGTATVQDPQHTFGTPGQHDVTLNVVTSNGCENTIVQTVDQIPAPGAPNTPTGPQEICQGSTGITYQTSSVTGANSYYWEISPPSAGTILGGSINAIANWDPGFSGTASVSVSGVNQCGDLGNSSGSLQVTINALPNVFAGADQDLLYENSTTIDDASVSGASPFAFSWEPADSLINAGILNPTTEILYTPTLFTLTVEDDNDCINSDEMVINIFGGPLGLLIYVNSDSLCFGDEIQLFAVAWGGSEEFTYSWTSDPPGFVSTLPEPFINPENTTTYNVTIFDGHNSEEASIVITVIDLPVVFAGDDKNIPNGVSTQLDGSVNEGAGAPFSYNWTPGNLLVSPYLPDPWTVNLYETESFILTGTDNFGCANTSMVTVTVSEEFLNVSLFSEDSCVCYGYTTNLIAAA
ncbi:MAG: PKD domain-containing protein, partial [Bacteroidales bacterium]|nr:PKD domain-containing protein [Bacteroidales bacterium]